MVTRERCPGGRPGRAQRGREVPARRAARASRSSGSTTSTRTATTPRCPASPPAPTPASSTGTTPPRGTSRTPSPRCASSARPGAARCRSTRSPRTAAVGSRPVDLGGSPLFVAEGIFAPEVVAACRDEGLLAAAYCITQHPLVTFWRRLTRDLREHRKPPLVLVRRGVALMRDQQRVVAHARAPGVPQGHRRPGLRRADRVGERVPRPREARAQPDRRSCGAAALVMARRLVHPRYAGLVARPGRPSPTRQPRCTAG